jgi:lipopolysaccharide export system protein LptC
MAAEHHPLSVELHLPDLPEVPISLGPPGGRGAPGVTAPWHVRLREVLSAYLPLLLMLALGLATWWLVKHSPAPPGLTEPRAPTTAPDYTMSGFALERFDAAGRLRLRIEGARLRHFPDQDRIEIDAPEVRVLAPDGRVTLAHARRALGNGDGSEVQLLGAAELRSTDAQGGPLRMRSEFLDLFLVAERVVTHLPVEVEASGSSLHAAGLDYDHAAGRLELKGPMRAELAPRGARAVSAR